MFNSGQNGQGIFSAEAPLSTSHLPDEVIGREQEVKQIAAAVRPMTRRQPPDNLIVYGPAGVGKTTAVSYVCRQLDDQTRTHTAALDCWQYNTRSALLSKLLIELGYPTARKGKPVDELLVKLREWLDKHHSTLVTLDEFDRHRDQAAVIYDHQHLAEQAAHELGLILIANQPPDDFELDPRSASRLRYRAIRCGYP